MAVQERKGGSLIVRIGVGVFLTLVSSYFLACMPYFLRPYRYSRERLALEHRLPEVRELEKLSVKERRLVVLRLGAQLRDADVEVRRGAARCLSSLGYATQRQDLLPVLPQLEQALSDSDHAVAFEACKAIDSQGAAAYAALPALSETSSPGNKSPMSPCR